jgi:putative membrane protein
MNWLLRFLVTAAALWLIATYVPGFAISHWYDALIAALIFGIVNTIIGPVLQLISLPLTILTIGLFGIVINWALFALTVWFSPGFKATGIPWPAWEATLVGSVIMALVGIFVTTPLAKAES